MYVKIVKAKYLPDADFETLVVAFDSAMAEADIRTQLDAYILQDAFGDVSIDDFAIDIHVQPVMRTI